MFKNYFQEKNVPHNEYLGQNSMPFRKQNCFFIHFVLMVHLNATRNAFKKWFNYHGNLL